MKNNYKTNHSLRLGWRIFLSALLFAVSASQFQASAQRVSATGGTYTIDATGTNTGTNFVSFTDAINDINLVGTVTGTVTFNVSAGQTFAGVDTLTPAITATGTGSTAQIIFQKSGTGANPVINPKGSTGTTDYGIAINGGDYITFNGIDIVATTNAVEFGYLIRSTGGTNGAWFNTITNSTILLDRTASGTRAIMQSANASFGGATTATAASGINKGNSYTNLTIGNTCGGVWMYGASATFIDSNNVVNNNTIGRSSVTNDIGGNLGNIVYGIYPYFQTNGQFNNNTFTSFRNTSTMNIIYGSTLNGSTINNNTFTGNTSSSTTYVIYVSTSTGLQVNNNTISNNAFNFTYGIFLSSATVSPQVQNNIIQNNTLNSTLYGVYVSTATGLSVQSNTVSNNTSTSGIYPIYMFTLTSATIQNNIGQNNTSLSFYGIYVSGITTSTVNNNLFNNNNAGATGLFYGIYLATPNGVTVSNNRITNATFGSTLYGIYFSAAAAGSTNLVFNNVIDNLVNNSTNTGTYYSLYGMFFGNATTGTISTKIYNNTVNRIARTGFTGAASATRYIFGMFFTTTSNATATYEVVHNTVNIDGSSSPGLSNTCIYTAPTTTTSPVIVLRNNVFSNTTGAQTSPAAHYLIYANGTGVIGASTSTSNYNNWYLANTTQGFFGFSGTAKATITDWTTTTGFTTYDANSITSNPLFNSAAVVVPIPGTPLVNAGSFLTGYTTDILGVTRNTTTPTIGAYENSADVVAPTITYTPLQSVYTTANRTTTSFAAITDNLLVNVTTGTAPRLYYKKTTNSNTFGANTSTTNGWKWVESTTGTSPFDFTIDYSLLFGGSVSINDTIQYFVVAQDTASVTNVASNPSVGFAGTSVASITSAPTTPNFYVVFGPPATFTSATAIQPSLSKVGQGTVNNVILRVAVTTSATGSPAYVSSLGFNTNGGGNDLSNISAARVYYTGTSTSFSTANLFGTTTFPGTGTGAIGAFAVTGSQIIPNGTTYFWLVYNMTATAAIGDSVDGELASVTYDGTANTTASGAITGSRMIRAEYCASTATSDNDEEIMSVTLGSYTNTTNCGGLAPGAGSVAFRYSNFTTVSSINMLRGATIPFSLTLGECNTGTYGSSVAIYADWNSDGDFVDAGETVYSSLGFTGVLSSAGGIIRAGSFVVPCTAALGETRIRIVYYETSALPSSCGTPASWGETEDYTLNILNNPIAYVSSSAVQNSTVVAPGATDAVVLRLPVKATGCGVGTLSGMTFTTTGSTAAADIVSAKLYATGNSTVFNTNKLLGTVSSPSGTFSFTGLTDTLLSGTTDTNNYWLTYDISSSATLSNVVDAQFTGIDAIGGTYTPSNGNPAGSRQINAPMTYVSSVAEQPLTSAVAKAALNERIVRLRINTSAIGSPISVSSIDLSTNGTTALTDIANIRVWYTGSNANLDTTAQFGSTITSAAATQTITGTQALANGTNYFWVTYSIASGATVGNFVDAEITGVIVGGSSQTPTTTAPTGNRKIRNEYCASAAYYNNYEDIGQVTLTQNSVTVLNNASGGCTPIYSNTSAVQQYTNFSNLPAANISQNVPVNFNICTINGSTFMVGCYVGIFVDYNQDGAFTANELVYNSTAQTTTITTFSGSFTPPCTALPGETRMRVVMISYNAITAASACLAASTSYYYGETEDYTVNIVSTPMAHNSTAVQQNTSVVAPGTIDAQILRIPVVTRGCGTAVMSEMYFNTSGTTSAANITAAKLYATGNNALFNTSKLLGTVTSPSGAFNFTGLTDTLMGGNADTNNYWLAYDVSSSAANSNLLDARIDSINVIGSYIVPSNNNPAGSRQVAAPMTYVSSVAEQPLTSTVAIASQNQRIVRLRVNTSAIGSPINLSSIDLSTNGTTSLTDISNIKVWYSGSNANLDTTIQFGSTITSAAATQTITGTQPLANGTNYFWVTYSIASGATVGNFVDAEITGVTVGGSSQTPTTTAPTGNRKIRSEYCASAAYYNNYEDIGQVTLTQNSVTVLNNASGGCATIYSNPSAIQQYSNFTSLPAANISQNAPVNFSICTINGSTFMVGCYVGIFVDYNQDGAFTANELVYNSTAQTTATTTFTGSFTPPCTALPGETRMRVVMISYNAITAASACLAASTSYYYGETEDYTVNIVSTPMAHNSTAVQQNTSVVAPGTIDAQILRIPVVTRGCGTAVMSEMYFNTSGTTSAANITAAKLYATGNTATFNSTKLLGTVTAPSGAFSFTGLTDTLIGGNADTNNYWLAYDISASAPTSNVVDARVDSINVIGSYIVPSNNNPAGNRQIVAPMTYISSTTDQIALSKVETGSTNNEMMRISVVTSATGSAISVTSLALSTNGSAAPATNITNAKVFYTGSSSVFAATNQFGTTSVGPNGAFTVSGNQPLTNGTNYFWVTYDIASSATVGDSVDVECTSITVGGSSQTPTQTAPAGARGIRAPYCSPTYTSANTSGDYITLVQLGSINNSTGPNPSLPNYTYYSNLSTNLIAGGTYTITMSPGTYTSNDFGAWIDYNGDGVFSLSEKLGEVFNMAASPATTSFTFTVPANASLGVTRLRVREADQGSTTMDPCLQYTYGETEDYNVNILPTPAPTTYTWNQTSAAAYNVATNWTPTRTNPFANDILVFNSGGSVTVNSVPNDVIARIDVTNNTTVTLAATSAVTVNPTSELNLTSGKIITGANVTMLVGLNATSTGSVSGTGTVEGNFSRWIGTTTSTYNFPMSVSTNNRSFSVAYSTAPTAGGKLTVIYVAGAPGTSGLPVTDGSLTLANLSPTGIWRATADAALTGGTYDVTITAANIPGVTNYLQTALVNRSTGFASWTAPGTLVTTSGSNANMVLSRTGLSAYGEFGIAGTTVNPLPVTWLAVKANNNRGNVDVTWITASEFNNKGFELERSVDGVNFEFVTYVKGAGTSSLVNSYSHNDVNAFANTGVNQLYYRVKQVDFNGKYSYSDVVTVNNDDVAQADIIAYPNPFTHEVSIALTGMDAGVASIEVSDISGRRVIATTHNVVKGSQVIVVDQLSELNKGVYFVTVVTGQGQSKVIKMVKN